MQCRNVLTRIDALRTKELAKPESHTIEEHLQTCPSCNESVGDIEEFANAIRSLAAPAPVSIRKNVTRSVCDSFDSIDVAGERVWVAFSAKGIRMIDLRSRNAEEFREAYRARFGRDLKEGKLPERYRRAVDSSIRGEGAESMDIDLSGMSEFERRVLETIFKIPRGEVRPYSWVARAVQRPKAARAVGTVMANNPIPFLLPCHRVVPAGGGVGNYGFGPARKRSLLAAEGAPVEELDRCARSGVKFLGSKTTKIFCLPTCHAAQRIREENRVPFHDEHEAMKKGFRPCKRCKAA